MVGWWRRSRRACSASESAARVLATLPKSSRPCQGAWFKLLEGGGIQLCHKFDCQIGQRNLGRAFIAKLFRGFLPDQLLNDLADLSCRLILGNVAAFQDPHHCVELLHDLIVKIVFARHEGRKKLCQLRRIAVRLEAHPQLGEQTSRRFAIVFHPKIKRHFYLP